MCQTNYTCMDEPITNACCDKDNGEPGERCCKNENLFTSPSGKKICCEDGQIASLVRWPDGSESFECDASCPGNSVENVIESGTNYSISICSPPDAPKYKGNGQFTGFPVCCNEDDNFCGGGCCPSPNLVDMISAENDGEGGMFYVTSSINKYCAPIKGSMIALENSSGMGLEVKEAQTCCPKDGQVYCGGVCCNAYNCVAPANLDELTKVDHFEFSNKIKTLGWLNALTWLNRQEVINLYQCCSDESIYVVSGVKGCCQAPNSYFVGENGLYSETAWPVCCNPDNGDDVNRICGESCCKVGEYCAYSRFSDGNFLCCDIDQKVYKKSDGTVSCCDTDVDEKNDCCPIDFPYFIYDTNYTREEIDLAPNVTLE